LDFSLRAFHTASQLGNNFSDSEQVERKMRCRKKAKKHKVKDSIFDFNGLLVLAACKQREEIHATLRRKCNVKITVITIVFKILRLVVTLCENDDIISSR
jgi:hypothetical protein